MQKIGSAFFYVICYCFAVLAGTFAITKSFGLLNRLVNLQMQKPAALENVETLKNCNLECENMQNCTQNCYLSTNNTNSKLTFVTKTEQTKTEVTGDILPLTNPQDYQTEAEAMTLLEVNSGRIIAQKGADKKLPMASLTKIITAIVAIENNADLDAKLEVPKEAVGIEGSSIYLRAGEHLTMRELLYGLMLQSGNDAAVAIAMFTSGSVEEFINLSNNFCQKLGLENTNLVTPNGLHDEDHYTTSTDLARVTAYALKNDTFAEIVSTKYKTIDNELGKKEKERLLKNKNKFLDMLEGADGVKTGYTTKAGRCFVGSATRAEDGMQIVCVLINCRPMFQDCARLIAQAQKDYKIYNLLDAEGYESYVKVNQSNNHTLLCGSDKGFAYPLTQSEYSQVQVVDNLNKTFDAPINAGESVGEVQILVDKTPIFCDNIFAKENAEDDSYLGTLDKVIEDFRN